MSGDEFLTRIGRERPAAAYLFLGPESYQRELAREALIRRALPDEEREQGLTRHDLDEISLNDVIDDARAYSLFAPRRVIWVSSAESALPRTGKSADAEESESGPKEGSATELADYMKSPTPDVVLVFQASRFDFEGEDKTKIERVRKFYSAVPAQVEFPRYTPAAARQLAQQLARDTGLQIDRAGIEMLVETLGADAARIATEIEKLRLFTGGARKVRQEDLEALIPDARSTTIFALVGALGRRDRVASLELLDTLIRDAVYLPLVLTFLATQCRLALVAREAGLGSASQIQAHFTKTGTPMWRSRAEQVAQTASVFSKEKLEDAIRRIAQTDRALRDTRPDDRVVMEEFVLKLT